MAEQNKISPYDAPELYDLLFDKLDFDIPYWLDVARAAGGPVLEAGCGTGRILLRLRWAGIDADGFDSSPAMIARLRKKAERGEMAVRAEIGDMREFSMGRRYALIFCAFNGFAHLETTKDQLRALENMREHLLPGGALYLHMSYPGPAYWLEPEGTPVLEQEIKRPGGNMLQLWDNRTKDVVGQRQVSEVEIRESDAAGRLVSVHRYSTSQRWIYRYELELLFRSAGFLSWEFFGGFDRRPLKSPEDQMIACALK
jgi:SAM-dependent methyltransferase